MNYKISIPKPCHEDWTAMTPNEQGRFCGQCAKTVTDFTGMKALEIQSYLMENSSNKVCGRFKASQLEKIVITIPERVLFTQTRFRNVFLLALLVTMGTTLFSCNNGQTIGEVAIMKDSTAVDSSNIPPPMHTLGMTITHDSLPPPPKSNTCGPVKGEMHVVTTQESHLTGAVAVDPVPTPPSVITGDIVISPKMDSLPLPPKVKE